MRQKIYPLFGFFIISLYGFAATPSLQAEIDDALSHLNAARDAGAETYAPLELRFANERMEQAQLALTAKDKAAVQRITEEVIVTAELASAKARLAKARVQVETKSRDNIRLRQELLANPANNDGHTP